VAQEAPRWLEITPSQFPHEAEGLARIHTLMPDTAPFRAWSNFEFRDGHGKWHEVDLLVLGRRRLHLVELKAYRGTLHGDDHRWRRDGKRAEDSPLKLARRKAQRLASKLQDELLRWAKEHGHVIPDVRDVVPFVQESVYLHHEQFRCELPPSARIDLFGLDGQTATTNLPGIRDRLLEPASGQQVDPTLVDSSDRFDNRYVRLRGDATVAAVQSTLRTARSEFGPDLAGVEVPVSEEAVKQLKFGELLPPALAAATLSARGSDYPSAALVAVRPVIERA